VIVNRTPSIVVVVATDIRILCCFLLLLHRIQIEKGRHGTRSSGGCGSGGMLCVRVCVFVPMKKREKGGFVVRKNNKKCVSHHAIISSCFGHYNKSTVYLSTVLVYDSFKDGNTPNTANLKRQYGIPNYIHIYTIIAPKPNPVRTHNQTRNPLTLSTLSHTQRDLPPPRPLGVAIPAPFWPTRPQSWTTF
jgi:hypothetical protein